MKRSAGVRLVVDSSCETIMLMMVVSEALFNPALPIRRRKKTLKQLAILGLYLFLFLMEQNGAKINATEL